MWFEFNKICTTILKKYDSVENWKTAEMRFWESRILFSKLNFEINLVWKKCIKAWFYEISAVTSSWGRRRITFSISIQIKWITWSKRSEHSAKLNLTRITPKQNDSNSSTKNRTKTKKRQQNVQKHAQDKEHFEILFP